MELFLRMPEATEREKELMRAITEPELVAAMVGNVKVTAPGLMALKQGNKNKAKAKAKGKAKGVE